MPRQHVVWACPCADEMGVSACAVIAASADTFAVNSNNLALGKLRYAFSSFNVIIVQFFMD